MGACPKLLLPDMMVPMHAVGRIAGTSLVLAGTMPRGLRVRRAFTNTRYTRGSPLAAILPLLQQLYQRHPPHSFMLGATEAGSAPQKVSLSSPLQERDPETTSWTSAKWLWVKKGATVGLSLRKLEQFASEYRELQASG